MDAADVRALVTASGLADVPLVLAVRHGAHAIDWAQGGWPQGGPVTNADSFYGASLGKQLTGAAVALLVRQQRLDPDAPLGDRLPQLPAWRHAVSARHLLHHLGGLPELDPLGGPGHWSNATALAQLSRQPALAAPPGSRFAYSNAGYICLALLVEAVAGQPFEQFVQRECLDPLQLTGIGFCADPDPAKFPQLEMMGAIQPLSLGDGGLWTTASAFAGWLGHQNRDTLGIADLVQQPGRLADGTMTDYGWGIGIRRLGGHASFSHGGGWPGARSKAIRCPALDLAIVALAATDSDSSVIALVDALAAQSAGRSDGN